MSIPRPASSLPGELPSHGGDHSSGGVECWRDCSPASPSSCNHQWTPAVRLQLSASSLLAFTDVSCHLSPLGRKTTVPSLTQIIPFLLLMSVKYIMQNHRLHIFRRCYPFFSRDTRSRNVVLCQPNLFFETDIVLIVSVGKSFKKNTFPSKHRI